MKKQLYLITFGIGHPYARPVRTARALVRTLLERYAK